MSCRDVYVHHISLLASILSYCSIAETQSWWDCACPAQESRNTAEHLLAPHQAAMLQGSLRPLRNRHLSCRCINDHQVRKVLVKSYMACSRARMRSERHLRYDDISIARNQVRTHHNEQFRLRERLCNAIYDGIRHKPMSLNMLSRASYSFPKIILFTHMIGRSADHSYVPFLPILPSHRWSLCASNSCLPCIPPKPGVTGIL